MESEVESRQSKISMVLGGLIILVMGILVFNYINKDKASLGPAQSTEISSAEDVSSENLPGKYTVKEGDTLFTVAEKYFKDGFKYGEIAKANKLTNPNEITTGSVIEIPKLEAQAISSPEPSEEPLSTGTGGGNTTIWGERIEGNTYTVVAGDWLSKIAGRAYGDIMAFEKIAKANNIQNPDIIEPGTVLRMLLFR